MKKSEIMKMAWTIYRNANCGTRAEFAVALKTAHNLHRHIPKEMRHLQVAMNDLCAYMMATGKTLAEAVNALNLEVLSQKGFIYTLRAPKAAAQREAMRLIGIAVKKADDKESGIVSGSWIKTDQGWMVAVTGPAFEGGYVRVVRRDGQESVKQLLCELPTEYGILWQVA